MLDTPVSGASPDVVVTPSGYTATLTVTDADKNTLYDGGVTGFRSYLFEENGTYDAKLVVKVDGSSSDRDSSVTGTETWQFQFTVNTVLFSYFIIAIFSGGASNLAQTVEILAQAVIFVLISCVYTISGAVRHEISPFAFGEKQQKKRDR